MSTYIARHAAATLIWKTADTLHAGAEALHAYAQRLDAWLAERAKSADDRSALQAMSERELRDIGVDPARVRGPEHCLRDWAA